MYKKYATQRNRIINLDKIYPFILVTLIVFGLFLFYANKDSIFEFSSYVVSEGKIVVDDVFKTTGYAIKDFGVKYLTYDSESNASK